MEKNSTPNVLLRMWDRLPLIVRVAIAGFFASSVGIAVWGGLLTAYPSAWVILPMILCLWLYCKFFKGSWGPKHFSNIMKENFRLTKLQPDVWKKGLLCAVFFVVIVQASFVVTYRLVDFPAAAFTADYKLLDTFPLWEAFTIIVMSSIVAAICEETGFRGYVQQPLEKRYGPVMAIVFTSLFFTIIHLSHTWARQIVPHIFFASVLLGILAYRTQSLIPGIVGHAILDVFDYSVWWSDIFGGFTKQTIFKTGIDLHFVAWSLILVFSMVAFFRIIGGLKPKTGEEKIVLNLSNRKLSQGSGSLKG